MDVLMFLLVLGGMILLVVGIAYNAHRSDAIEDEMATFKDDTDHKLTRLQRRVKDLEDKD